MSGVDVDSWPGNGADGDSWPMFDQLDVRHADPSLALYRVGPPWILAAPELPLRCSMCYRRVGDITMVHGRMALIMVSMQPGIPEGRPPSGRHATGAAGNSTRSHARRPRSRGWVFVSPGGGKHDRWRIWCEHKQAGRGVLDRTVTASTLERLYAAALAAGAREVVLT